jgi:transcriptional regulator GlxA family with amidase domain
MSPLDYLSLLRAEAAKKLLRETDMPVREIGVRVGYYDPGSFARRFKQITGLTPVQYRKGQEAGEGAEN